MDLKNTTLLIRKKKHLLLIPNLNLGDLKSTEIWLFDKCRLLFYMNSLFSLTSTKNMYKDSHKKIRLIIIAFIPFIKREN